MNEQESRKGFDSGQVQLVTLCYLEANVRLLGKLFCVRMDNVSSDELALFAIPCYDDDNNNSNDNNNGNSNNNNNLPLYFAHCPTGLNCLTRGFPYLSSSFLMDVAYPLEN